LFGFATTEISNKCSECPPKKLTKTLCEMYRYIVGVRPLALRNKLRALLKPFGRVKGLWRHLSGFRESSALAGLGIRSTAGGVEMGALCSPCRTLASWLGCWGIGIISFLIRERFTPCSLTIEDGSSGFRLGPGVFGGGFPARTGFKSVWSAHVCLRGRFGRWSSIPCRANRGCRSLKLFNVPRTARSSLRFVLTTQLIGPFVLHGLFAQLDDLDLAF